MDKCAYQELISELHKAKPSWFMPKILESEGDGLYHFDCPKEKREVYVSIQIALGTCEK